MYKNDDATETLGLNEEIDKLQEEAREQRREEKESQKLKALREKELKKQKRMELKEKQAKAKAMLKEEKLKKKRGEFTSQNFNDDKKDNKTFNKAAKKKDKEKRKFEKEIGKKKKHNLLSMLSYKNISEEINSFGYNYSFKSYLLYTVLAIALTIAISIFYFLEVKLIVVLAISGVLALPFVILGQYRFLYNNDRFEQLVTYMEQVILSFKVNPKILPALESTLEIIEGELKENVEMAIEIIKTEPSENVYRKAFDIIEHNFHSSRLRTLHRYMLTVEESDSIDYQDGLDNLTFDIRSWVTRTYEYQAQLRGVKQKVLLICGLSVIMAAVFANLLNEAASALKETTQISLIENPVYQGSSLIYLMSFVLIFAVISTKVNGSWLVNDVSTKREALTLRCMDYVDFYNKSKEKNDLIAGIIVGGVLIGIGILFQFKVLICAGIMLGLFLITCRRMMYKNRKRIVERELQKEFPVWLRDISVHLNSMVVIRAIDNSIKNTSAVMQKFLLKFIKRVEKNPTSVKPYKNFLGVYHLSELATVFKTLYSIRTLSAEDSSRQIQDLIQRNQTLLENGERLRNEDYLAGVSFLSMLPMLLMSFKLILDLSLLLLSFLSVASVVL